MPTAFNNEVGEAFFAAHGGRLPGSYPKGSREMAQNLVMNHLSDEQWTQLDGIVLQIEQLLMPILVSLGPLPRRRLRRMGDGSEAFCRRALEAMTENRGILPRDLDVEEMRRDLESHDALNARITRLTQLMEKLRDTEIALGSDVMSAALEGYAYLKIAGKSEGFSSIRKELGKRFEKNGRRRVEEEEPEVA